MATRAEKTIAKEKIYFSDFLNNFDSHPLNNTLARVTNENSIKQSLRNLILTDLGERLFQPTVGSDVRKALFEQNDIITAENIKFFITNTIKHNEPRVVLLQLVVKPTPDYYAFNVNIIFEIINNNVPISLNLILRRVR